MAYNVEYTDEFERWWASLSEAEHISIDASVTLLEVKGPHLPFPYSSGINGSKHSRMRELRIQHKGDPYRIIYAFDPRQTGILLIGGNKVGDDAWYDKHVPIADKLYDQYLQELKDEGLLK